MSKKRVRGLRRHWRRHQQRATVPTAPDLAYLAEYNYDYDQLGLAPWTVHGRPPLAFRRLWATRLLTDLQQWREQLVPLYPDLYLAIWLYDIRFGLSQVVTAIEERRLYYAHCFKEAQPIPLPIEYQDLPGVADLTWTAHAEVDVFTPDEFAELGKWDSRRNHWRAKFTDGNDCLVVQVGWVWVGRVPTT
ncbi:hypothetical protein QMK33_09565 [Hymenobacter sp. H14-R3]|uniref:hypothetical protein n=1 Tax=Hymenobacter sp. H14-R3 TaxID=3046308 RepID=UPI0024B98155|nr:hypothetical protein [Hymenobacter sp. H14-R3]MDJ0365401.1 hypothetical protein [Hymenobacter sp. H14-R3]